MIDILYSLVALTIIFAVFYFCVIIFKVSFGITIKIVSLILVVLLVIWAVIGATFILDKLIDFNIVDISIDMRWFLHGEPLPVQTSGEIAF